MRKQTGQEIANSLAMSMLNVRGDRLENLGKKTADLQHDARITLEWQRAEAEDEKEVCDLWPVKEF